MVKFDFGLNGMVDDMNFSCDLVGDIMYRNIMNYLEPFIDKDTNTLNYQHSDIIRGIPGQADYNNYHYEYWATLNLVRQGFVRVYCVCDCSFRGFM